MYCTVARLLEVLWIEDSRGELEPATLDAIDRNVTDEYTLEDGVWYEGIIDSVTKSYAKVRFDEDGVTKQLNLFKEFEASNRWRDGSLVRWLDGSLKPIGGWTERKVAFSNNPVRGMHSWQSNNGTAWLAGGSHKQLIAMTGA